MGHMQHNGKLPWDAEYKTLVEQNTWELTELPPGRRPIGVKWVFKIKTNAVGEIEKFKARLVARGFSQIPGVDFEDTYAPVSRYTTFRVLMALAANQQWEIIQLDVKNAFLYGELEETELYMKQPPGYSNGTGDGCRLLKSIYGLKQAPLVWYHNMGVTLFNLEWQKSENDWALYWKKGEKGTNLLLLYVDDILLMGPDPELLSVTIEALQKTYKMHKENLEKYLGVNIHREKVNGVNIIGISLERYGKALKDKFNLTESQRYKVPFLEEKKSESEKLLS